jgi:ubiquinone/menaquinone biosynthesis C-methylase UbiE
MGSARGGDPPATPGDKGDGVNRRPVAIRYQDPAVVDTYDQGRFHGLGGRYNNWRLHRLLNKTLQSLAPGSLVLDIPCGTGRIDAWLLKASLRVIAADISSAMLGRARQKVRPTSPALGFLRADAHHLPFRSGSVDAVFSIRFLHLLDQHARLRALHEVARVARHWAVLEYRRVEKPLHAAKRVIAGWLTGRTRRTKKLTVAEIADELSRCGLVAERCYFVSRWFSGSVLIMARRRPMQTEASDKRQAIVTVPT